MLNIFIFGFVVLVSFIPCGIESQATIEYDVCSEVWGLKQENDVQRMALERMERQVKTFEQENVELRTSLERKELQLKTCEQRIVINSIQRLNQSTSSASGKYEVVGVTKREDRIYVLCRDPNFIRVFEDRNPFRLLTEIHLTQISRPNDIVYNDHSKCFYVADSSSNCIWKVTITSGYQIQETRWLNGTTHPHSLSLSSDGYMLVRRDGHYSDSIYSRMEIYNGSDARLIRSFQLPSDIQDPVDAIQTQTAGEFLISHKLRDRNSGNWVISRMSRDGQTFIAQSNPRNNEESLSLPWHMYMAPGDNRLFVVDYGSGKVILFDPISLNFRQVLLTSERNGIRRPFRMHYDREKKQLILGQSSSDGHHDGVVDVYEIN